jgi:Ca2+-binding RTX toxin-like protein
MLNLFAQDDDDLYLWYIFGQATAGYPWGRIFGGGGVYAEQWLTVSRAPRPASGEIATIDLTGQEPYSDPRTADRVTFDIAGTYTIDLKNVEYVDGVLGKSVSLFLYNHFGFTTDGSIDAIRANIGNHEIYYTTVVKDSTLMLGAGWDQVRLIDHEDLPGNQYWTLIRRDHNEVDAYSLITGRRVRLMDGAESKNAQPGEKNYGEVEDIFLVNSRTGLTEKKNPGNGTDIPDDGDIGTQANVDLRSDGSAFSDSFNLAYFNFIRYTSDNVWVGEATIHDGTTYSTPSDRTVTVAKYGVAAPVLTDRLSVVGQSRNGTHDLIVSEQAGGAIDGKFRLYTFQVGSELYNEFNQVFLGGSGADGISKAGIVGTNPSDRVALYGFGGNDVLTAGSGKDYIFGGQSIFNLVPGIVEAGNQVTGGIGADYFGVGNTNSAGTVTGDNRIVVAVGSGVAWQYSIGGGPWTAGTVANWAGGVDASFVSPATSFQVRETASGRELGWFHQGYGTDVIMDWNAQQDTLVVLSNGVAVINGLRNGAVTESLTAANLIDLRDYAAVATSDQDFDGARGGDNWDGTQTLAYVYANQGTRDANSITNELDRSVVNDGLIVARGLDAADTLYGSSGDDWLYGNKASNRYFISQGGNDRVFIDQFESGQSRHYVSGFTNSSTPASADLVMLNKRVIDAFYSAGASRATLTQNVNADYVKAQAYSAGSNYLHDSFYNPSYTADNSTHQSADGAAFWEGMSGSDGSSSAIGLGMAIAGRGMFAIPFVGPIIGAAMIAASTPIYGLGFKITESQPHRNAEYLGNVGGYLNVLSDGVNGVNGVLLEPNTAVGTDNTSVKFLDFFEYSNPGDGYLPVIEFSAHSGQGIYGFFALHSDDETFVYAVASRDNMVENSEAFLVAEINGRLTAADFRIYDGEYDIYNYGIVPEVVLRDPLISSIADSAPTPDPGHVDGRIDGAVNPIVITGTISGTVTTGSYLKLYDGSTLIYDGSAPGTTPSVTSTFVGTNFSMTDSRDLGTTVRNTTNNAPSGANTTGDDTFLLTDERVIYTIELIDGETGIPTRVSSREITISGGNAVIDGGDGDDILMLTETSGFINGAADNRLIGMETILLAGTAAGTPMVPTSVTVNLSNQTDAFQITSSSAGDLITGSQGNDTIFGLAGADSINAHNGNDVVVYTTEFVTLADGTLTATISKTAAEQMAFDTTVIGGIGTDTLRFDTETENLALADVDFAKVTGFETIALNGTGTQSVTLATTANATFANGVTVTTIATATSLYLDASAVAWTRTVDVTGTNNADTITTGSANDTIDARSGSDTITAAGGNDQIVWENTTAGAGVTISAGDGNDLLNSGAGDIRADSLLGGNGDDSIYGGGGNDTIDGGTGADSLLGEGGNDTIRWSGSGDRTVSGGDGNDFIDPDAGDTGNDSISGNDGNDTIYGGGGDDTIDGGIGTDSLIGEDGNDTIRWSGSDSRTVLGGAGDDFIDPDTGETGNDSIYGNAGNDTIYGGGGSDSIEGGDDADRLYGEGGADTIHGGAGADSILGGEDADVLIGGADADTIIGNDGSDVLWGGQGADTMSGAGEASNAVDKLIVVGDLSTANAAKITLINNTLTGFLGYNPNLDNTYTTSDVASGGTLTFDGSGNDELHAFGTVDLTGVTINGTYVAYSYSTLELTEAQLALAKQINFVGTSNHTVIVTDGAGNALSDAAQQTAVNNWMNAAGAQVGFASSASTFTVGSRVYEYLSNGLAFTSEDIRPTPTGGVIALNSLAPDVSTWGFGPGNDGNSSTSGGDNVNGFTNQLIRNASGNFGTELSLLNFDDTYVSRAVPSALWSSGLELGGTTYNNIYIGSNGYITFGSGSSSYSPTGLAGSSLPMIAAQYDDLWPGKTSVTAGAGSGTSLGTNRVYSFEDSSRWVITFDNVGVYMFPQASSAGNLGSAFQIILHKPSGDAASDKDFGIEIRYEEVSLNTTSATAGWTAGNRTDYGLINPSGTNLHTTATSSSNVGVTGVWAWSVEGGNLPTSFLIRDIGSGDTPLANGTVSYMTVTSYSITGEAADQFTVTGGSGNTTFEIKTAVGSTFYLWKDALTDGVADITLNASDGTSTVNQSLDVKVFSSGLDPVTRSVNTLTVTATSSALNAATNADITITAVTAAGAAAGVLLDLSNQTEALTITGSGNADTITGGSGADTIIGGNGNDRIIVQGTVQIAAGENYDGGDDNDTLSVTLDTNFTGVSSIVRIETIVAAAGVDLTFDAATLTGQTIAVNGTGDNLGETLTVNGTSSGETINLSGLTIDTNDIAGVTIDAGAGADTITGTNANDTIVVDGTTDIAAGENYDGGGGNDTLSVTADTSFAGVSGIVSIESIVAAAGVDLTFDAASLTGQTIAINGTGDNLGETLTVNGTSGAETINLGSLTIDTNDIAGATINAGNGNDTITGTNGNDYIDGSDGDDVIVGGAGRDTLVGGAGADVFDFDASSITATTNTLANMDVITDFDSTVDSFDLGTSATNITITAIGAGDGGDGDDYVLSWESGGQTQYVRLSNTGSSGLATATQTYNTGGSGILSLTVTAGPAFDVFIVTDTGITVSGDSPFRAFLHDDADTPDRNDATTYYTKSGNQGASASHTFDFTVIKAGSTSPGESLGTGVPHPILGARMTIQNTNDGANNTHPSYVYVGDDTSGALADTLTAGVGQNSIMYGFDGSDTITGDSGNDSIFGGAANDSILAGNGNDMVSGGAGVDTLSGGSGDDIYYYASSGEMLSGGAFIDNINDSSGSDRIVVAGSLSIRGDLVGGGIVNVVGVESLSAASDNSTARTFDIRLDQDGQLGSVTTIDLSGASAAGSTAIISLYPDPVGYPAYYITTSVSITGVSNGANTITGGAGNDTIFGGAGGDRLTGGAGSDGITGGAGADVFIFSSGATGISIATADTITDFTTASDSLSVYGTGAANGVIEDGSALADFTAFVARADDVFVAGGTNNNILVAYNAHNSGYALVAIDENDSGSLDAGDTLIILSGIDLSGEIALGNFV